MINFISVNAGILGLLFFVFFFLILLLWVYRPGASEKYKDYGEMPLKEGKDV